MEMNDLVDLLAKETDKYYKMYKYGVTKGLYNQNQKTIKEIQAEIQRRKKRKS